MSDKLEGFYEFDTKKIGAESGNRDDRLVLGTGTTTLRILPPWRQGAMYYKVYKMHFNLGALAQYGIEVNNWFAEPCLAERYVVDDSTSRVVYGPCPLCKLSNTIIGAGTRNQDDELVALGKSIRAKVQNVANAVNMDNKADGVKLFVFGKKIQDTLKAIFSKRGNITHPITGRNITITKKDIPNQKWSDYTVMPDDPSSIEDIWPTVVKLRHNLDEYPQYSTYEDLSARVQPVLDFLYGGGTPKPAASLSNGEDLNPLTPGDLTESFETLGSTDELDMMLDKALNN